MTLLPGNKNELDKLLSIADEFYNLNDIQINKDKKHNISILPVPKDTSIRILGVWFNAYDDRKFVLNQCKNDILTLITNTLRRKVITDKQTAYIFNMIILSRIEYRSQVTIFTEKECSQTMVPYRKMFKNKFKLATSAPNSIIENNLIYNIRSVWANQIQAKINNFFIQINDKNLLGKIMDIRLITLQNKLWLVKNPIQYMPYQERDINTFLPKLKNNFILKNIFLMKNNKVTTRSDNSNIVMSNQIIRGHELIIDIERSQASPSM
ncbi:hypothetical protein RhiirA4_481344 [Rhizophagus irregularis]|uniref:Uncharacterized protein n=1 Tax=Rhizophagus irregularis TaxID=588596 RepID=A0A2I1HJE2_9GLOM|nr:hypothetical protein RhiirA4_481344 [Rhizophagus irregularis]